jgi:hypothetical protein
LVVPKENQLIQLIHLKTSLPVYFFHFAFNDLSLDGKKRVVYTKGFDIVIEQENDSLNRKNLFLVANRYYNSTKKNFHKTVRIVLEKSELAKDTINIAKSYTYLGDYYESAVSDSAFFVLLSKAEKMYEN